MRVTKTLILLVASLATTIGACFVESHPGGYYYDGYYHAHYRCPYGYYYDGYRCRHY